MNATYRGADSDVLLEVQNLQTEFHLRSANVNPIVWAYRRHCCPIA